MARTAVTYTDNAHKFRTVIGKRVEKALVLLEGIARGANADEYTSTPEQVKKMMNSLKAAVEKIEKCYAAGKIEGKIPSGFF